jgi:hypothetical protein
VRRRIWLAVPIGLALVATLTGVTTGYHRMDTDEAIYRTTLHSMRRGQGYYPAMRDGIVYWNKVEPGAVTAIRPPTLFLFLRVFPEGAHRWLVGFVYFGVLLAAWKLGGGRWYEGLIACVLAELWLVSGAPYYFLHQEVWGLPFLMFGALALRNGSDRQAALLVAGATVIRELFAPALLIGLILRRRKPWLVALAAVGILGAVHYHLASQVLSATGTQAPLTGQRPRTLEWIFSALTISGDWWGWVLGGAVLLAGLAAMVRLRDDPAVGLLLPFALLMLAATVYTLRFYWCLAFAPAVAAMVPGIRSPSSYP